MATLTWTSLALMLLIGTVYSSNGTDAPDGNNPTTQEGVEPEQDKTTTTLHIVQDVTGTNHDHTIDGYQPGKLECYTSQCRSQDEKKCREMNMEFPVITQGCHSCGESLSYDTNVKSVISFRACQRKKCHDRTITMTSGSMYTYIRCCNNQLCNNATMGTSEEMTYDYVPNIIGVENMEQIDTKSDSGH